MGLTGAYTVRGTFTRGMPGDGFTGTLAFLEAAPPGGALRGLGEFDVTIGGKKGMSRPMEFDEIQLSDDGEVSFDAADMWHFSGVLHGDTINGTHMLHRPGGKTPIVGSWIATRVTPNLDSLPLRSD